MGTLLVDGLGWGGATVTDCLGVSGSLFSLIFTCFTFGVSLEGSHAACLAVVCKLI